MALVASEWHRTIRTARRLARGRLNGGYLEVSYEALVADPEKQLPEAMAFLGEAHRDDLLNPTATLAQNATVHVPR